MPDILESVLVNTFELLSDKEKKYMLVILFRNIDVAGRMLFTITHQ